MGYKEEDCKRVLPLVNNDVNLAVEKLLDENNTGNNDTSNGSGKSGEGKYDTKSSSSSSGGGGKKQLEIELPEGLEGGMEIAIEDPETGKQHTVVVPKGYTPGTKFMIDVE